MNSSGSSRTHIHSICDELETVLTNRMHDDSIIVASCYWICRIQVTHIHGEDMDEI